MTVCEKKVLILKELHLFMLYVVSRTNNITVQFSHIKSVRVLFINKTNCNRTKLASPFHSPQQSLKNMLYTISHSAIGQANLTQ